MFWRRSPSMGIFWKHVAFDDVDVEDDDLVKNFEEDLVAQSTFKMFKRFFGFSWIKKILDSF